MRALAFLLAALLPLAAQAAEYDAVRPEGSRITFVSTQMGVPVEGRFRKFVLDLAFDPARPQSLRADLAIDLASVDGGSAEASAELVGKDWFDTGHYPTARFEATGLAPLGGNRYMLRGSMTLKGRRGELSIPITFTPAGNAASLDGSFVLKRLQWGIGTGEWGDTGTVADAVRVNFHFLVEPGREGHAAGSHKQGERR